MELRRTPRHRQLWTRSKSHRTISLFVVFFVVCILNCRSSCAQCVGNGGCYPPFVDLLPDLDTAEQFSSRSLNASSTCGDPPSQYNTTNFIQRTAQICNASDPLLAHPVLYVQDSFIETVEILGQNYSDVKPNLATWWQSENGKTNVTLTLSLQDQFFFQSMQMSFKSKKPEGMVVEARNAVNASTAEEAWYPLQYFAKDCSRSFPGIPTKGDNQDKTVPFCEVLDDPTADVQEQELVLYNPSLQYLDEFYSDETLYRHYMLTDVRVLMVSPGDTTERLDFFAVSDWEVKGQCSCFGHAAECTGENENVCQCAHNTRGVNCEECLPLYNNRPWRMGTREQANICQACGCNGHASSCYYDAEKGYGVCDNCTDNTQGDKCDQCKPFHYLSREETPERNTMGGICRACNCTTEGITNNGTCDNTTGQCTCKEQVFGRTCDTCKAGFWNLTADNPLGCQACDCDASGTFNSSNLCDQLTGNCVCKDNTEGDRCDRCKVGSYNLTEDNPAGCTLCECDPGGSVSSQCNSTGHCECRPGLTGKTCSVAEEGFFVPSLDYLLFEAEVKAIAQNSTIVELDSTRVTGSGYLTVPAQTDVYFNITVPASHMYAVVLRYNGEFSGDYVCVSPQRQQGCHDNSTRTILPAYGEGGSVIAANVQLDLGVEYTISIYPDNNNGTDGLFLDSLVLLPVLNDTTVYQTASPADRVTLTSCWTAAAFVTRQTSADCQLWGIAVTAEVYGVQECSCNSTGANGTTCSPRGGQCACLPGVVGRGCDMCAAYTYGIMSGQGCSACDCDQSGSMDQSCDPETGACCCHANVLPPKCDSCAEDHYGLQTGQGCQPCTCNLTYSYNNSCGDDGQCPCKPGVGGMACTECMEDYYGLTEEGCTPCGCNRYGSLEGCRGNGTCHCRNATEGDKCDVCKPGYYGLGNWSDDGCLSCFCSQHSSNCSSSPGWYQGRVVNSWSLLDGSGINESRWQAVDGEGGTVTVEEDYRILERLFQPQIVLRLQDTNHTDLYFSAPEEYLGDKRSAYLQSFVFTLSQSSVENQTDTLRDDVIISGWYRTDPLVRSLPNNPGLNRTPYEFKFHEDEEWFVGNISHRRRASKADIITVLSNITQILIRAKYTTVPGEAVDLYYVQMDYGTTDPSTGPPLNTVEACSCPVGYQGQFCEECAPGYTREVPGLIGDPLTLCVPCDCNGHEAGPCHVDTGVCSCTDNTTGDHCELCVDGFYGDALLGTADSCQPCACPGLVGFDTNYFAETCDVNGTCHNCTGNHVGDNCQDCAEGFYGEPTNATNLNGACLPCDCTDSPAVCDGVTGQCLNCTDMTGGDNCDRCADGWYGLVMANNCTDCRCNSTGSTSHICDYSTGQCDCQPNIIRRQCDGCEHNYWNFSTEGCTPCNCHQPGAVSQQCDLMTGECNCTDHAEGLQCEQCETGYYHNQQQECVTCNCSTLGTVNGNMTCDPRTGQCDCRSGVRGQKCDQCDFGFEGDFPNCTVCPPCFNASVFRILNITEELNTTFEDIQGLWGQYGNMSVEEVRQILAQLNRTLQNVTGVLLEEIVDGRNIRELNMLYGQIRNISAELESQLARLNSTQADLDNQLDVLAEFNGTAVIDGQVLTPESTGSLLDSVKVGIANRTATANSTWLKINQIQQDLNASLTVLYGLEYNISNVNQTLLDSENLVLQTLVLTAKNYSTEVQENVEELGRLNRTATALEEQFTVLASNVSRLLQDVQEGNLTVQQSLVQAEELVRSAAHLERRINQTHLNSSAVQMTALATLNSTQEYQIFANASLSNITGALAQLTSLRQVLADVNNKTTEAGDIANGTLNMSIRQLQDMVNLSREINSTTVAEELVNTTLQGAQEGLQTAQALRNVTQTAEEEAGRALSLVQQIETSLVDSNDTRQDVRTTLQTVEAGRQRIQNITAQVTTTAQSSHAQASTILSDVFLVRGEVGRLQQCFVQGRLDALQLGNTARGIYTVSESNTQTIAAAKQQLTAAQTQATSLVDGSEALQQEALELQENEATAIVTEMASLQQVAEIQDLLDVYIARQQEMEDLETEMTDLEGQLDSLISSFEAADPTTQQCSNP